MDRYGKEVEVMCSRFVAYADAKIEICGWHLHYHIDRNREWPAFPKNLHDTMKFHCKDKTSIVADNNIKNYTMLPITIRSFVSKITCDTWWNDRRETKYCATNWKWLVLLTMVAHQLASPAYSASYEELRAGTKLARRRAWVIPSKYSRLNTTLPIIISNFPCQ